MCSFFCSFLIEWSVIVGIVIITAHAIACHDLSCMTCDADAFNSRKY